MIIGRKHAEKIHRLRQDYTTRLNKVRLGMNEHVPTMPDKLFSEIITSFTNEMASAYPEVNQAYDALSLCINQPRDRLILTSGADMAIKITLEAFCEKGDRVLTCSPTFAMYKIHAQLLNCELQEVYCNCNGDFDVQSLVTAMKCRPRILIMANPNGVTGHVFCAKEIQKILREANKIGVLVVLDETYADFAHVDNSSLLNEFDNLVIIRSFSKNIGFAGIRIGYILSTEYLLNIIEKFKPMMEINSLAVHALKVLCTKNEMLQHEVNKVIRARHSFALNLKSLGFNVIEKGGNFILVDFKASKEIIAQNLQKNNIEFKQMPVPLNNYIRFTIATSDIMDNVYNIISTAQKAV